MSIAKFDVSPKIIKILGEELIHDKKIAISELVKNAYDADATEVAITIKPNEIIIQDNGHGMEAATIQCSWLTVGSSKKRDVSKRTLKFKRLPLGEKGVGRLGVHRLGKKIEIISKSGNAKEVTFKVDWNEFENTNSLKELTPISIIENEIPLEFTKDTGTKLIIKDIQETFDDKDITNLKNDLRKLVSPFKELNSFEIQLFTSQGLFDEKEDISLSNILEQSMFQFEIEFEGETITAFNYNCTSKSAKYPDKNINLTQPEIKNTISVIVEKIKEKNGFLNTEINLGKVLFKGYIFEPNLSKLFNHSLNKETKQYLKDNGGIRVYRDGIRVYNYGEDGRDNDILNLDRKRASKFGSSVGYNQILAAIELNHESSSALKEKTNREGFIHNNELAYLVEKLECCMEVVMHYRNLDKVEMKLFEEKIYDRSEIEGKIKKVINDVNSLTIPEKDKYKIIEELTDFDKQYKEIENIFLTASNTGLNLTFIVHEVDKIIDHLEQKIKEGDINQIKSVFLHLQNSIETYKETVRLDKKDSTLQLFSVIEQAIFNSSYRFKYHNIELVKDFPNEDLKIIGKKGLIIGSVNNLLDNAIYWLDFYKVKHKKILIRIYSQADSHIILIADNGKGFNMSFEAALRPFSTGRIDGSSMGIGLHLAKQIMEAHRGSIALGNYELDNLPEEFSTGAIVKLNFPKEMK